MKNSLNQNTHTFRSSSAARKWNLTADPIERIKVMPSKYFLLPTIGAGKETVLAKVSHLQAEANLPGNNPTSKQQRRKPCPHSAQPAYRFVSKVPRPSLTAQIIALYQ